MNEDRIIEKDIQEQPSIVYPTQESTPPPKQTKLAITFIISVLVILGVIGYFLFTSIKIKNQIITTNPLFLKLNNVSIEPTAIVNKNTDQTVPFEDYSTGDKLIENLNKTENVPETIVLSNGNTLNLYRYKEEKINPYCNDSNDESCKLEPIFGDYSKESGFMCLGNPFYNPLNPSVNKLGFYRNTDAEMNTVPMISENYTILKFDNYELFTGSQYELFLLKDGNNKCHPYKLKFGYLEKGISPNDKPLLSAVRFKVSDKKISSTNYSEFRFGCARSSGRLVENDKTLFNYVDKETVLANGVVVYKLKSNLNYDYDNFSRFNFISSVTDKKLQDGGYALLSVKPTSELDLTAQRAFLTELSTNKSVLFVSDPIFPEVLFVYVSFENILYPGC